MTYKIIYVDEQDGDGDDFKDFVEQKDTDKQFGVVHLKPAASLEEMLALIQEQAPDAVVSDYKLNEHIASLGHTVPYDGIELISNFLQVRTGYPCFVITSFPNDAAKSSEDVNVVYVKNVLHEKDNADLNFLERIRIQVNHYRARIRQAEDRVKELLLQKEKAELSLPQEKELIALDSFLESSVDGRSSIPEELKTISNEKKLSALMLKVDTLLAEIRHGK